MHVQTKIKEFEQLSEHIKNEHLDRKISNFEIEFVMKSIKNKKACGTDGIAGELIKYGTWKWNEYDAKRIVSAYMGKLVHP